eukprot:4034952-Prymnesium_polylepis.1
MFCSVWLTAPPMALTPCPGPWISAWRKGGERRERCERCERWWCERWWCERRWCERREMASHGNDEGGGSGEGGVNVEG